ncbi:hypothetical protein FKM82_018283 [Ascaphus truei]
MCFAHTFILSRLCPMCQSDTEASGVTLIHQRGRAVTNAEEQYADLGLYIVVNHQYTCNHSRHHLQLVYHGCELQKLENRYQPESM